MTASPEQLVDWLTRTALRDRASFERLYRATAAQLFGLILRIVKNRELASEILQEGFIKIWHRAGDYRADKAQALTWMSAIVRNQAIDSLRRGAHQPTGAAEPIDAIDWLADDALGPLDQADQDQQNQLLRGCIEQLEGEQRQAMLLAYFQGLTHEELAAEMRKPLGTVKSWLRRGLMRLKNCLDQV
ncbi:MAG: sigma-70 family RNA polymerase sigma factor [Gammaproteobacteria bacterium]